MAGSIYAWSKTAGSNSTADGDINWTEGQLPSTINDSARQMMGRFAEWRDDHGAVSLSGTDTLTLTANSAFTTYATGRSIIAKVANTNTSTTVTLNVNAIGAKRVKVIGASGEADPEIGSIVAGMLAHFVYDAAANSAAGAWILINPLSVPSLGGAQPLDADLTAIAALTSAADKVPYATGAQTWALADLTTFGRTLIANADAAAARADLDLEIGTDVQAYDAELAAIAGLTSAANKVPYFTGSGTAALADLPSFGRTLIANSSAGDARTDLGLTAAATLTYEANTYSPVLTFATNGDLSVTYSVQDGYYVQIGPICFFFAAISTSAFTHSTASGNLQISLPKAVNASYHGPLTVGFHSSALNYSTNRYWVSATAVSGGSVAVIRQHGDAAATTNITHSEVASGSTVTVSIGGFYFV